MPLGPIDQDRLPFHPSHLAPTESVAAARIFDSALSLPNYECQPLQRRLPVSQMRKFPESRRGRNVTPIGSSGQALLRGHDLPEAKSAVPLVNFDQGGTKSCACNRSFFGKGVYLVKS
jgi:hypothetical protein